MVPSEISGIPETLTPRPSPLNIPELLHHIFNCLDDYELTRYVLPVCRLWFLLHQHRIAREAKFDESQPQDDLEQVILGLPWATRLCWSAGSIKMATRVQQRRYRRQITATLKDKHDNFKDNRFLRFRPVTGDGKVINNSHYIGEGGYYNYGTGGLDGLLQGSMAPLRELQVIGRMAYEGRVAPLLPFLSTLQRLQLRLDSYYLNLGELMEAMPSLEMLDIRASSARSEPLGNTFWMRNHECKPSLLRSLIFGEVGFPQANIEALLTMSPHLRELKLFDVSMSGDSPVDSSRLLNHIRSLSLPLKQLYISIHEEPMTPEFLSRLIEICPLKDEFISWDFPLEISQVVQQSQNTITTLELAGPGKCEPVSTLHRYLCSSPQLLHLRAPGIEYLVNHMDIHHLLSDTNTSRFKNIPETDQPQIWACSNLQTLHLGIHSISGATPQDPLFDEQGRVLFGYISRVTPHLRDLSLILSQCLTRNGDLPTLRLESGLCLLARLTKLERLRIGGELSRQAIVPEDVEWMLQSGHSLEARARRRALVNLWNKQVKDESDQQDARPQRHQRRRRLITLWNKLIKKESKQVDIKPQPQQQQQDNHQQQQHQQNVVHQQQLDKEDELNVVPNEQTIQLQDLGRLVDVEEMVEEMDSKDGFSYWSELTRVSIFSDSEFGLSVERECQRELARLEQARIHTH
ncbi:hypothetical protein BGZ96_008499 [Linnemannia gamsii]|uniref:F-box domain-containing protein n=1 Tax=Linnemannia gamsii TaxID=64522 RepID=A0ABQ7JYW5_9FUNG|nr:hypothetical protein BGZ96_008499 [Linnemannia gamsii]